MLGAEEGRDSEFRLRDPVVLTLRLQAWSRERYIRAHTSLKCSPFSVLKQPVERPHTLSPGQNALKMLRKRNYVIIFKIVIRSHILIECCNSYYSYRVNLRLCFLRKWNKRENKNLQFYPSGAWAVTAAPGLCLSAFKRP